jgi:hypothetical protein
MNRFVFILAALLFAFVSVPAVAVAGDPPPQQRPAARQHDASAYVPELSSLVAIQTSELRDVVDRFVSDRAAMLRRHDAEYSPSRRRLMKQFYDAWNTRLDALKFDDLGTDGRIDYLLLKNRLHYESGLLDREETVMAETASLMPFVAALIDLQEARREMAPIDPAAAAAMLARVTAQIDQTRAEVEAGIGPSGGNNGLRPTRIVAYRASNVLTVLGRTMDQWYRFYAGYDPLFTWWAASRTRTLTGHGRLTSGRSARRWSGSAKGRRAHSRRPDRTAGADGRSALRDDPVYA